MPNTSKPTRPRQATRSPQPSSVPELVDPTWILKALGIVALLALICAWITICAAFSYTQWQIVLHPTHDASPTPASLNLPFSDIRFAADTAGQPQLHGWFLPAALPTPSTPTVLILHSGNGTMANALPDARLLHDARLNVLLFDYRGFGTSSGAHPTQALMQSDADAALTYLTSTRNLPLTSVVVYGTGVGASLAVRLCAAHAAIPALILNAPEGDLLPRAQSEVRSRLVPVRLLFHEDFPLATPLQTLTTPKLLLTTEDSHIQQTLHQAADPKMIVTTGLSSPTDLQPSLTRFLDTYLRP